MSNLLWKISDANSASHFFVQMGVEGLWKILNSTKEIVTLESLNGKILAVDLSIWIYQALRGGGASKSPNAHLKILFFRICKLLFYGVKPIFVFDGPNVPHFKQLVLSKRRLRKAENALRTSKIQKKMVKKLSQMIAKGKFTMEKSSPQKSANLEKIDVSDQEYFCDTDFQQDLKIQRQNLPENSNDSCDFQNLLRKNRTTKNSSPQKSVNSEKIDLSDQDISDTDFQQDLKIERQNLPENSNDFCDFQIQNLLTKNRATKKSLEILEKNSAIDIDVLPKNFLKIKNAFYGVDRNHFLLEIKPPDEKINKSTSRDRSNDKNLMENEESRNHDDYERDKSINFEKMSQRLDNICESTVQDQFKIDLDQQKQVEKFPKIDNSDRIASTIEDQKCKIDQSRDLDRQKREKSVHLDQGRQKIDNSDHIASTIEDEKFEIDQSLDLDRQKQEKSIDFDQERQKIDNFDHIASRIENQKCKIDQSDDLNRQKKEKSIDFDQGRGKIGNSDRIASTIVDQKFEIDQSRDLNRQEQEKFIDFDQRRGKIDNFDRIASTIEDQKSEIDQSRDFNRRKVEKWIDSEKISGKIYQSRDFSLEIDIPTIEKVESRHFDNDQKIDKSIDQFSSDDDSFVEVLTEEKEEAPTTSTKNVILEIEESFEDLKNLKQKLESREKSMTSEILEECKFLIRMFNLPIIESSGEAESECARLELLNFCQGIVTDDSDVWLFGAKNVYRHVFDRRRYVERYTNSKIYEKLGLTRGKMIKLAMLTGCDYTEGLKGVGSITGLEILSEFCQNDDDTKIDDLKKFRSWYENHKNSKSDLPINNLRRRLLNLDLKFSDSFPDQSIMDEFLGSEIDNRDEKIDNFQKLTNQQAAKLKKYALENLDFNLEKLEHLLKPALEKFNGQLISGGQLSIKNFTYRLSVDDDFSDNNSKRLTKALNKLKKTKNDDQNDEKEKKRRKKKK